MKEEEIKKIFSEERMLEKQHQILGLADDLLATFRNSDMFRKGRDNQQLFLDAMLGIATFTCGILEAMINSKGGKGKEEIIKFYQDLLPIAYSMRQEMYKETEEIEENKKYS